MISARFTCDGGRFSHRYEKRNWLLAAQLPETDPHSAQWNTYAVADAASAGSQLAHARLGYYNAGFLSTSSDGGTWSSVKQFPVDDRDPYFEYMTAESPYVEITPPLRSISARCT